MGREVRVHPDLRAGLTEGTSLQAAEGDFALQLQGMEKMITL